MAAVGSTAALVERPTSVPGLDEEDQIREAKYLPRERPRRLFEEERFVFPESYGVNRIRLLVRDPEWIFAYWDVNPAAMRELGAAIGERALALSQFTLRIIDPASGAAGDILLPPGARWWYVRTDSVRRTYVAELGLTLPSGEYRRLAASNKVVTPRMGPSPVRARRKMTYAQVRDASSDAMAAAGEAELTVGIAEVPWAAGTVAGAGEPGAVARSGKGGASDELVAGVARRGKTNGFRR